MPIISIEIMKTIGEREKCDTRCVVIDEGIAKCN